jgi:hypothetical protein
MLPEYFVVLIRSTTSENKSYPTLSPLVALSAKEKNKVIGIAQGQLLISILGIVSKH